jgi:integral membrane protein
MAVAILRSFVLSVVLMTKFQLNYLRFLGIIEGLSLIFLLFIAMPVRMMTHDASIVQSTGAIHGLLFLMFVYTLIDSASTGKWGRKTLFMGLTMSCLPFGTFWFDKKVLRNVFQCLEDQSAMNKSPCHHSIR